jgi:hypothetical protein
MPNLKGIGLQNFRTFKDYGYLEFAPIIKLKDILLTYKTLKLMKQKRQIMHEHHYQTTNKFIKKNNSMKDSQANIQYEQSQLHKGITISLKQSFKIALFGISLLLTSSLVQAQAFVEQTGVNNPLDGVDTDWFIHSKPVFVDVDNDGDMDVFIGNDLGSISFYENTGSNISPNFIEKIGADNPFDGVNVGTYSTPNFVDIDSDGDKDAFIGGASGIIKFYENTGSNISPNFIEKIGTDNPFDGVDVGSYSAPTFVDIDNDGDMDAFVGEFYGNINFYENTGIVTIPNFVEQTGTNNPFDGEDVGNNSIPTFIDIDNDGDMDAFSGQDFGHIIFYRNRGSNIAPDFIRIWTGNPLDIDVDGYSSPAFVDIDSDGDMDFFTGKNDGTIKFYSNGFLVNSEAVLEKNLVFIFPNPVVDELIVEMEITKGEVVILNILGQVLKKVQIEQIMTSIDVSSFSQGQYMIIITTDEGKTITKSFVK